MFSGSIVALVTPFKNGGIDEKAFQELVDWQVTEGTHGLVPCGTTGESPTLSHAEHHRVIELCIEAADGRVPVIAGTGSNSTDEAIDLTRHAKKAGADGALLVTPYYNKPTQEGMYQHFKAIHDAVDLPLVLYNIPGRSVVNLSAETLERLARLKNIVGIKDATGDIARVSATRLLLGPKFCQLSGEDATALGFNAHGGHGCISVTANVAPSLCARFQTATLTGDWKEALALQDRLMPLHSALFLETSPAPVKYAVSLLGRGSAEVRLPLVGPTEGTREKVRAAMMAAGVLN
ncbi:MAG: 4-hydroxy-tetrahydrodipicolinate synthase [Alphaproteobacteria bacterium]|nr:4-hydroxy-tetrahydrodipicolinate synthase [Alphaproteobacteria bacterium]